MVHKQKSADHKIATIHASARDALKRVKVERVEGYGKKTTVETWINEEAILFAKYLRDERDSWIPRIVLF